MERIPDTEKFVYNDRQYIVDLLSEIDELNDKLVSHKEEIIALQRELGKWIQI